MQSTASHTHHTPFWFCNERQQCYTSIPVCELCPHCLSRMLKWSAGKTPAMPPLYTIRRLRAIYIYAPAIPARGLGRRSDEHMHICRATLATSAELHSAVMYFTVILPSCYFNFTFILLSRAIHGAGINPHLARLSAATFTRRVQLKVMSQSGPRLPRPSFA